ncbi:MAG: glycosyltransferase, partial [Sphaerospermopsis kisseleviana]
IKNSNVNIVVISDWLKRQAEASPILNNKPIHRIYNGIDLKVFKPVTSAEKTSLRDQLQIPNSKFAILLAGQTVEGINQGIATRYAVDALNQLSSDLVFPVVLGRSANRVLNMIHHPGIAVPFQDEPQNMAQYFQACDLTLVTSEVEAFGRIAAESQACGTPVVSFDSGGLPEVVLDKIGGRIVPRSDVKGLIQAIDYFYSNPSVREQCSIQGIAHVR